jgi:hypothetical protein
VLQKIVQEKKFPELTAEKAKLKIKAIRNKNFGVRGGAVVKALRYKRLLLRFPMVLLEFFIDTILPIALWSWGRLSF